MASVKVAVRVRPFNKRELNMSSRLVVDVRGNQVVLDPPPPSSSATPEQAKVGVSGNKTGDSSGDRNRAHKFTFDFSYWSHCRSDSHFAGQDKVFSDLGTDVVGNAFNGYNVCVFAYGQTGSGKTYTMMGNEDDDEAELGLIPRICQTMFAKMQNEVDNSTTYRTEASYLEIYNERVKDLLGPTNTDHRLKVREHPKEGPYVQNLSKHLVMDYPEIRTLMERGNAVRTTAATNMNDTSSRSHAIFTVTFVKAGFCEGLPHETVSKIHLVDLAGSERADASGATGQRLKEGGHINKSLVTLGSVISALAEASSSAKTSGSKPVFIPYRDSVLTWLLKDSLGGNSKTIMIATISPAEVNHGETLSTLRYANRAKNIINKPTVNEDANVKLIRELRDEIDRLRASLNVNLDMVDPNAMKKLAVKEAQERHLTEEWTEKWKVAAKILDEHKALALKQTGLGVSLDSEKPHLVGIDEDVLSTGITLYHLNDGDTRIGQDDSNDIVLKGTSIQPNHCVISLTSDGIATLTPSNEENSQCKVNTVLCSRPTRLYQGCVIVLGKTNMFRYNDPTEAANMRLNLSNNHLSMANQSLLSQSMSDLRSAAADEMRNLSVKSSTPVRKKHDTADEEQLVLDQSGISSPLHNNNVMSRIASPDSVATMTPTSSQDSAEEQVAEMGKLYEAISDQKDIIMGCLESEQCDVTSLNEQLSLLQTMQKRYSKLEFEQARHMWMAGVRHLSDDENGDVDYESQFSSLVEQEVERRLFQEKVLKAESEFQERELWRMERERELAVLRRQHEREIYMLKRRLHEQRNRQQMDSGGGDQVGDIELSASIPTFRMAGLGSSVHVEYEVNLRAKDGQWTVLRRFRQFRDLHVQMCSVYGESVASIPFPSRRLFGNKSDHVSHERQRQLQSYLNTLLLVLSTKVTTTNCSLYRSPFKSSLMQLSGFFQEDVQEAKEN